MGYSMRRDAGFVAPAPSQPKQDLSDFGRIGTFQRKDAWSRWSGSPGTLFPNDPRVPYDRATDAEHCTIVSLGNLPSV